MLFSAYAPKPTAAPASLSNSSLMTVAFLPPEFDRHIAGVADFTLAVLFENDACCEVKPIFSEGRYRFELAEPTMIDPGPGVFEYLADWRDFRLTARKRENARPEQPLTFPATPKPRKDIRGNLQTGHIVDLRAGSGARLTLRIRRQVRPDWVAIGKSTGITLQQMLDNPLPGDSPVLENWVEQVKQSLRPAVAEVLGEDGICDMIANTQLLLTDEQLVAAVRADMRDTIPFIDGVSPEAILAAVDKYRGKLSRDPVLGFNPLPLRQSVMFDPTLGWDWTDESELVKVVIPPISL